MTSIFETLKRLQRLPRIHRIAHLQALVRAEKPRSHRYAELWGALRYEMRLQLRDESRSQKGSRSAEKVTPASETAA